MSFAPEILADVPFGLSNNILIQIYTQSYGNSINLKYAILKEGLTSGMLAVTAVTVTGNDIPVAASLILQQYLRLHTEGHRLVLLLMGSRDGAVVIALASHQCDPGSIPGPDVISGLSLLLVLVLARPRVFLRVLRFSSLHKNQHF